MKTEIAIQGLCKLVAGKIGWVLKTWQDGHPDTWLKFWFDKNDAMMFLENRVKDHLLTPDGCDLMEKHAENMDGYVLWYCRASNNFITDKQNYHYAFFCKNMGDSDNEDKNKACLLAFAQLVKVYDPETQEVVW